MELGKYLASINKTKVNLMRDTDDYKAVSDYPAFIVRRLLSYHYDAIFYANEANCLSELDAQMQYEFFLHALPKRNRFANTHKVPPPEHLELVKRFYGYNDEKALEVLVLHTEEDFARMRSHLSEGGVIK
jgi:hypothetical protein